MVVLFLLSATIFNLSPSREKLKVTRRPCLFTAVRGGMVGVGSGPESRPSRSMRRSLLAAVEEGAGG